MQQTYHRVVDVADQSLLERSLGVGLTNVTAVAGGFSRARCWSVRLADGRQVFVKEAADEEARAGNRNEAIVLDSISSPHLPAFVGIVDEGRLLVTEDLGTADWSTQPRRVDDLWAAIVEIGSHAAPPQLWQCFQGSGRNTWQAVATDDRFGPAVGLGPDWLQRHGSVLGDMSELADTSGEQLVHGDLAPGNWCLDTMGTWRLVDWASAYRGNPVMDEVIAAVRLTRMAGVPVSSEHVVEHPELVAFVGGRLAGELLDVDWTVAPPQARIDRIDDIRASLRLCAQLVGLPMPSFTSAGVRPHPASTTPKIRTGVATNDADPERPADTPPRWASSTRPMASVEVYREVGEAAWTWVLSHVAEDDGPWLPATVSEDGHEAAPAEDRDSLYAGIAGLAPVLAEIGLHRPHDHVEQALAAGIVERLRAQAGIRSEPSLFDGSAGDAVALRLLAPGSEQIALRRLVDLMTPTGWDSTFQAAIGAEAPISDVIGGIAGIVLAAIWAGGEHAATIAHAGGACLLRAAEPTEAGLDWGMWPGMTSRMPNYSHGTAGIATALAVAGQALDRQDFVGAARMGAAHLLSIGGLDDGGFIIPHTIPPSRREVDPVTFGWCHGPTGTSYLFAALAHAGVTEVAGMAVTELHRRCLRSILSSGVPQRIRPGFWDNDGRCCGTAGVGDALLDAAQDSRDPVWADELLAAARTMGDALVERAIRDEAGARWRFLEHRDDPPLLPPGTSWMQGAAGIAAFLLRLTRVVQDGPGAAVVDRADQWWAVPLPLRTVHAGEGVRARW